MLDHEKLDVYQCALQFGGLTFQILQQLPRGHADLSEQLKRAVISIPLNIAESTGRPGGKDRAHVLAVARGSAMECGAIFNVLVLQGLVEVDALVDVRGLLVRLVAMLSKMCR